MPISGTAEKNALATEYGLDALYAALFTADPGAPPSGSSEVAGGSPAYARKSITWGAPSNGVITATVTFDVPAGTTITYAGVCSSDVEGANTVLDKVSITSQAFSAQGTYVLTLTYTQT